MKKSIFIYLLFILFTSVAYSFFNTNLQLTTTTTLLKEENNYVYSITDNGSWSEGSIYAYNNTINITYTGNVPAYSFEIYLNSTMDSVIRQCTGAICTIENNIINIKPTSDFTSINPNQSITFYYQLATIESNYIPEILNITFNTDISILDLENNPYTGIIVGQEDNQSNNDSIVWNFNNNNDGGWYIESINSAINQNNTYSEIINFNNGKALAIKKDFTLENNNNINNLIALKNDSINQINNFNDYSILSYKVYLPASSNITQMIYNNYVYDTSNYNLINTKFDNNNLNISLSDFTLTSDNKYYVFQRVMNRTDINTPIIESSFMDQIRLFGNYSGYFIIDSITLSKTPIVNTGISGFNLNISVADYWSNTTQYNIVFENTNNSNVNLNSWEIQIEFPLGSSVVNLWGGTYIMQDNSLIITPEAWNTSLNQGSMTLIGVQINTPTEAPYTPTIYRASGITDNYIEVDINV